MARKKPSPIGELSGKAGDLVYKSRNGKPYASGKPKKYNASQLPHEIDKRNLQKITGKFGSLINSSTLLKAIWNRERGNCQSGYNKISKVKYHLCEPDHPTEKAMITPEGGFKLEADEIYVLPDGIEANLRPIKLMPGEKRIEYITILSLWNPRRKSKKTDPFAFLMPKDCTSEGTKITFRLDEDGTALVKEV